MTVSTITGGRGGVEAAIARASQRTGVDFSYLLGQARVESGLNPSARAGTSSATGLFQFVDQSWLAVVRDHGAKHGMGWAADAIARRPDGRLAVSDPSLRQAVMGLRTNSEAASLMAAEHAADNKAALETSLGREATGTDLYMAHFLGLGGARRFLGAMASNPGVAAAGMFPAAAAANRNVFHAADGSARSLAQVYERFAARLGDGAGQTGNPLPPAAAPLPDEPSTFARFAAASGIEDAEALLRPRPDNARLAYMMLASLGG